MYFLVIFLIIALILNYVLRKTYENYKNPNEKNPNEKQENIKKTLQKEGVEFIQDSRFSGFPNVFPDIGDNEWKKWWSISKQERVPNDAYFDIKSPFIRS